MKNDSQQPSQFESLFPLGEIVFTPGAMIELVKHEILPATLLDRHVSGDWGDISENDRQQNLFALRSRLRIFSSYKISLITTIWVISEADRSLTTLLLPDEY